MWRSCRQLQVVHPLDTVVSLLHGAFSRCRALRVVIAPGCQHLCGRELEEDMASSQIMSASKTPKLYDVLQPASLESGAAVPPCSLSACSVAKSISVVMTSCSCASKGRQDEVSGSLLTGVLCEEIPCRDVHLARCLQFAMHKFRLSLFVKDLEPGGSKTFCFLIV